MECSKFQLICFLDNEMSFWWIMLIAIAITLIVTVTRLVFLFNDPYSYLEEYLAKGGDKFNTKQFDKTVSNRRKFLFFIILLLICSEGICYYQLVKDLL